MPHRFLLLYDFFKFISDMALSTMPIFILQLYPQRNPPPPHWQVHPIEGVIYQVGLIVWIAACAIMLLVWLHRAKEIVVQKYKGKTSSFLLSFFKKTKK